MRKESDTREPNPFGQTNPVAAYLKEIGGTCKLSTKAEKILLARIHKGDRAAMNALIHANLKFVVAVCRNYENHGLPMADLINEGNLGLIRAVARFDVNQDCRFISYAVWWIRQGILNALAEQTRDVALSTATTAAIHRIKIASRSLAQKLFRDPSVEELELETGYKSARILDCIGLMGPSLSLDHPSEGEDGVFRDCFADETEWRTESAVDRFQTQRAMALVMKGLSRRERQVIESLFGMGSETNLGISDLAHNIGVSRGKVRQLKSRALAKLKVLLNLAGKYPCFASGPAY